MGLPNLWNTARQAFRPITVRHTSLIVALICGMALSSLAQESESDWNAGLAKVAEEIRKAAIEAVREIPEN